MQYFRDKKFEKKLKRLLEKMLRSRKVEKRSDSTQMDMNFLFLYLIPFILLAPILPFHHPTLQELILFLYPFITLVYTIFWVFLLNLTLNKKPGNANSSHYPISPRQYFDMLTSDALKRFWVQQVLFFALLIFFTYNQHHFQLATLAAMAGFFLLNSSALLLVALIVSFRFPLFPFFKTAILAYILGLTVFLNDNLRILALKWVEYAWAVPTFGANFLLDAILLGNNPTCFILPILGALSFLAFKMSLNRHRCDYHTELQPLFDSDFNDENAESPRSDTTTASNIERITEELNNNPVIPSERLPRKALERVFTQRELNVLYCIHGVEINIQTSLKNNLIIHSIVLLISLLYLLSAWNVFCVVSVGVFIISLLVILINNFEGVQKTPSGTVAIPFVAYYPISLSEIAMISLKEQYISLLSRIPTGVPTAVITAHIIFGVSWLDSLWLTIYTTATIVAIIPMVAALTTSSIKRGFKSIPRAILHFSFYTVLILTQVTLVITVFIMIDREPWAFCCVSMVFAISLAILAVQRKYSNNLMMDFVHRLEIK